VTQSTVVCTYYVLYTVHDFMIFYSSIQILLYVCFFNKLTVPEVRRRQHKRLW